jgi:hypothetical protein
MKRLLKKSNFAGIATIILACGLILSFVWDTNKVCAEVITEESPFGACVYPPQFTSDPEFFQKVADSAVAGSISWIRLTGLPTHIQGPDHKISFSVIDFYVKPLDEHDLAILPQIWPYWDTDSVGWEEYWNTVVDHYNLDGDDNDMPGLRNPIKYWKICYEPGAAANKVWHIPHHINQPIGNVATPRPEPNRYYVALNNNHLETLWDTLYYSDLQRFYEYTRVSSRAIHNADPGPTGAKVVAPSTCGGSFGHWVAKVIDSNNETALVEFWYSLVNTSDPGEPPGHIACDNWLDWKHFLDAAGGFVDVIDIHGYPPDCTSPVHVMTRVYDYGSYGYGSFHDVNQWCDDFYGAGNERPFWNTEFGWSAYETAQALGISLDAARYAIAVYYKETYDDWVDNVKLGNLGTDDKLFLFKLYNDASSGEGDHLQILTRELEHYPAYDSVKSFIIHHTLPRPTNMVADAISYNEIELRWEDNSDYEENYIVQRKHWISGSGWTDWGSIGSVGKNVTTYHDNSVEPYNLYRYHVCAADPTYRDSDRRPFITFRGEWSYEWWDYAIPLSSNGEEALAFNNTANIVADDNGRIHVFIAGKGTSVYPLYYSCSDNGGNTWKFELPTSYTGDHVGLAVSGSGEVFLLLPQYTSQVCYANGTYETGFSGLSCISVGFQNEMFEGSANLALNSNGIPYISFWGLKDNWYYVVIYRNGDASPFTQIQTDMIGDWTNTPSLRETSWKAGQSGTLKIGNVSFQLYVEMNLINFM